MGYDDLGPTSATPAGDVIEAFSEVAVNSPDGTTYLLGNQAKQCVTKAGITCQTFAWIKCRKN